MLATGGRRWSRPSTTAARTGCFVYRTIEDLEAIHAASERATSGIAIGGGLLGLEAANALMLLGLDTTS